MSMSISASSNALSYLQQMLLRGSGGPAAASTDPLLAPDPTAADAGGADQSQSNTTPTWSGAASSFQPGTLAALISLQGQSANRVVGNSPSDLFSQLDTDGDGQISKTEFEQALGAIGVDAQSADALFGKLDANSDGSVTHGELGKAHGHGDHHHNETDSVDSTQGAQQGSVTTLLDATDITGATTQTATNSDGSTTTTISYADGTSVSLTTPAGAPNAGSSGDGSSGNGANGSANPGSSNSNLIEELIRMQSQLVSQAASILSTIA
ncbi:MAG TPA: EF-hand domain-containing protein [Pseudolabrys sp.]|nr:EF-hand domain-containing protein [Pseudolabrys sp.]